LQLELVQSDPLIIIIYYGEESLFLYIYFESKVKQSTVKINKKLKLMFIGTIKIIIQFFPLIKKLFLFFILISTLIILIDIFLNPFV
jgi:hypothetical protein